MSNSLTSIVIFGGNGMLGRYLTTYLSKKYNIYVVMYGTTVLQLRYLFETLQPLHLKSNDLVINCFATMTMSSKEPDMYRVNAEFPHLLSHVCDRLHVHLIHISTAHDTAHDTAPDLVVLGEPRHCSVLRTSLIGEELDELPASNSSLIEWLKQQKDHAVNGYINRYWNGVTCLQLVKVIETIIDTGQYWVGLRYVVSYDEISHFQLLCLIANTFELNIHVVPIVASEPSEKRQRPKDTEILPPCPSISQQLIELAQYHTSLRNVT
jgi:dTDP-4-dehydrorhamnose reductase